MLRGRRETGHRLRVGVRRHAEPHRNAFEAASRTQVGIAQAGNLLRESRYAAQAQGYKPKGSHSVGNKHAPAKPERAFAGYLCTLHRKSNGRASRFAIHSRLLIQLLQWHKYSSQLKHCFVLCIGQHSSRCQSSRWTQAKNSGRSTLPFPERSSCIIYPIAC